MNMDLTKYKVFVNNQWKYGDIKISYDSDFNKHYYIINKEEQIEVDKDNICKRTKFIDKNGNYLYVNDIISIKTDKGPVILIISKYDDIMKLDNINIYMNGLTLSDFDGIHYLPGFKILEKNDDVSYEGNTIESNIDMKEVKNDE